MSEETVFYQATNFTFKRIVRAWCRVDDAQGDKFPENGPYIMAVNHINFMEIPVMYTHLVPRPLTGFVKAESFDRTAYGWLFKLWGGISAFFGLKVSKRARDGSCGSSCLRRCI